MVLEHVPSSSSGYALDISLSKPTFQFCSLGPFLAGTVGSLPVPNDPYSIQAIVFGNAAPGSAWRAPLLHPDSLILFDLPVADPMQPWTKSSLISRSSPLIVANCRGAANAPLAQLHQCWMSDRIRLPIQQLVSNSTQPPGSPQAGQEGKLSDWMSPNCCHF